MNKIANIFITIVFLVTFTGVQINEHYLNGKLYSIEVFGEPETCCDADGSCDMSHLSLDQPETGNQNDCSCDNRSKMFRLQDVFINEKSSVSSLSSVDLFMIEVYDYVERELFSYNLNTTLHSLQPEYIADMQSGYCLFLC